MSCEDEYIAGENVTHLFTVPDEGVGMVLSIRFTREEVQELFDGLVGDGNLVQQVKAVVLAAVRAGTKEGGE